MPFGSRNDLSGGAFEGDLLHVPDPAVDAVVNSRNVAVQLAQPVPTGCSVEEHRGIAVRELHSHPVLIGESQDNVEGVQMPCRPTASLGTY